MILKLCYLGLGGNISNELGTPTEHIYNAVATLENALEFEAVKLSSLYRSKAFGVTDQPDFINAVVACQTTLSPHELLEFCQQLEQKAGRVRLRRWGERSLDVDVLLYDDAEINEPHLIIPHGGLMERNFVLIPLLELNPDLIVHDKRLSDLPVSQDWTGLEKLV